MKNRKIIDLYHYGNKYELVFTLGDDADVLNCSGDNWDTAPFAESDFVSKKFVKGHFTVNLNYNTIIEEPLNDMHHCRNDFKNHTLPCLAIVPPQYAEDYKSCDFNDLVKEAQKPNSPIILVYFGDGIADVYKRLRENNTIVYRQPGSKRRHVDKDDFYYDAICDRYDLHQKRRYGIK